MLYLAFSGCSLLWSAAASLGTSALYWCGLACDAAIVVLLARSSGAERTAHSLMKGFVGGSCLLAAIAWMMPAAEDLRLGDLDYFNTNQIGNLCALSVLMCNLLRSRGDGVSRYAMWFLVITLFRSLSKSTLIAFAACLVYGLIRDSGLARGKKWLFVGSAIVLTLVFWGLFSAYYDIYTTGGNQAETLTGRTAIWAWTLDAALNRPWFGNGFDAMWKVAPPFGGELFEARHAENELLQQFFAYGVCGVALLAGIYGGLYRRIRRLPKNSERVALTAFLIYVLVRGVAEAEPFDLLLPLWLIAALAFFIQGKHHIKDGNGLELRANNVPAGQIS
jgi:O-antigen ligase